MATATRNQITPRNGTQHLLASVGYCRMSTDRQDTSIEKQQEGILAWAEKNGCKIVRWYIDEGISGDEQNREQFQQMVYDAQTVRDFEAIVCWNQKRFARFDVLDTAQYWKALRDAEIKLFTVNEGLISFDSIAGILTAVVNQDAAHAYLVDLGAEICTVQRRAAEAGYWPCSKPPLGYVSVPSTKDPKYRTLKIDDETAPIVRRMFAEYLAGLSICEIAHRLNVDGIKTSRGNPWGQQGVKDILRNEAYTGAVVFGRKAVGKYWRNIGGQRIRVARRGTKCVNVDRSQWSIVSGAHPAIISADDYQKVQDRIARRKALGNYHGRSEKVSPISGLCRCGHCGHGVGITRKSGTSWRGVRCAAPILRRDLQPDCGYCIGLDNLVERVIARVEEEYLSDAMLEHYRDSISKYLLAQRGQGANATARLTKSLTEIDAKILKAEDRLVDVPDDMEQALYRKIRELKDRRQQIQAELTTHSRLGEISERVIADQGRALIERLKTIRANIRCADQAKARAALEEIVERITIWTAPITKRQPGMSNAAKRSLSRVHIEYRSPICILQGTASNTS